METLTNVDENTNCNTSVIVYIITDSVTSIENLDFHIDTVYNWSSETKKHLLNLKNFGTKPKASSFVEYFKQFKKSKSQLINDK